MSTPTGEDMPPSAGTALPSLLIRHQDLIWLDARDRMEFSVSDVSAELRYAAEVVVRGATP